MANLTINRRKKKGRHHITIAATPKFPETRTLLRQFHAGVSQIEKKWKAVVRKRKAKARKKGKA